MISVEEVIFIHDKGIERYGGSKGIRDLESLKSAIQRPFQTFGGEDLYPSPVAKASAIIESILMNHPFIDGNKRTGLAVMLLLLQHYGFKIIVAGESLYSFVVNIASGVSRFDGIVGWLEENTTNN